MGSSRADSAKSANRLPEIFAGALAGFGLHSGSSLLVAFSGGLDSTVLLRLTVGFSRDPQRLVRAIHVHHGLHPAADRWRRHCQDACASLGVVFLSREVNLDGDRGNLEERARQLRYAAMTSAMETDEVLLLGHHRGDLAETFFLNLMRGTGVRGLSGIPAQSYRHGRLCCRPLLNVGREELRAYAREEGLRWVEDDSNADLRFDRNYLRAQILPALKRRWPRAENAIARAAGHLGAASAFADEVAMTDLEQIRLPHRNASAIHRLALSLESLRRLTPLRRDNVLRFAVRGMMGQVPDSDFLHRLAVLVKGESGGQLHRGPWVARTFAGALYFYRVVDAKPPSVEKHWDLSQSVQCLWGPFVVHASGESEQPLTLRARMGGERLQLAGRAHRHSLKKLLQERGVPPWERAIVPLIYCGDRLVAIPGVLTPDDLHGGREQCHADFRLDSADVIAPNVVEEGR